MVYWYVIRYHCIDLIAAGMASACRKVVEESFKWANQRQAFGKSLLEQPVIRNKVIDIVFEYLFIFL